MKLFTPVALLATLLCFVSTQSFAQQRECAAMDVLMEQINQDPERQAALDAIETHTQNYISQNSGSSRAAIITIPVVVHVVYNTSTENISDAQVLSQIQILNEDFRRTNSDADGTWSQAADTEIEFCLATVDPSGNSTTGITRTFTSRTSFGTNDDMKRNSTGGKDAWPAGDYLNMWVCDISGGILGYAQFPGGPAATDGVVMDYQYFGNIGTATAPFDLGRTATHEVGHWLNLRHIWGDGPCGTDDFVSDTPTSDNPNYGCAVGHVSCSSTDMVQNYMDYSDDGCMNLFTAGQTARMRALFDAGGARASLLSSGGCGSAPTPTCSDGIQNGDETGVDCGGSVCPPCATSCTDNEVTVTINLDNYPEETSWTITNDAGSVVASGGTYGAFPDGSTVTEDLCLVDDCYTFTINDSYGDGICCAYGSGSYTVTDGSGSVLASGGSFGSSEATDFCFGGTPPPPGPTCTDGIQNGDETGIDCGGSVCAPCSGGGCSYVGIDFNDFESGWGIWNDGGSDCRRSNRDADYALGTYCVRLRDNTSSSVMTTDNLNLSSYDEITVDFSYYCVSMDNANEDFWLQISTDGGSTYTTVEEWNLGDEFNNNARYYDNVVISGPFSSNTRVRFRCDASANGDRVYIDEVDLTGCLNGARQEEPLFDEPVVEQLDLINEMSNVKLFPNPTVNEMTVRFELERDADMEVMITDLSGKVVYQQSMFREAGKHQMQIQTADFANGIYLLHLINRTDAVSKKFVVSH
jgi:hypothetical protein